MPPRFCKENSDTLSFLCCRYGLAVVFLYGRDDPFDGIRYILKDCVFATFFKPVSKLFQQQSPGAIHNFNMLEVENNAGALLDW